MKDYLTEIADLKEVIRLERDQTATLERELVNARAEIEKLKRLPNRKPHNMHFYSCKDATCAGCYQ